MTDYCTLTGTFRDPAGVAFGGATLELQRNPSAVSVTGASITAPVPPASEIGRAHV